MVNDKVVHDYVVDLPEADVRPHLYCISSYEVAALPLEKVAMLDSHP